MIAAVRLVAVSLATVAVVAVAITHASRAAVSQTISAGINNDQQLTMTFADGTPIGAPSPPGTLIPPGTYQVNVNDGSDIGNVDLNGRGVNDATGVDNLVQVTWNVTFQPCSIYSYTDDTVATSTQWFQTSASATSNVACASITPPSGTTPVVTVPAVTTPSTTTPKAGTAPAKKAAPSLFRGTLVARVSKKGSLSLETRGKEVTSLLSGTYAISVTDDSSRAGFTLQEISRTATTLSTTTFVGKRSHRLELTPGQWFFYPSFVGRKSYFIVTSRA